MRNETVFTDVTALLLAGGQSTRFGKPNKLLATYERRPLPDHVVTTVSRLTGSRPVIAVRSSEQREAISEALFRPNTIGFASDDRTLRGPIAGIYGGLDAVETPWVLICAGDMPLLSSEVLQWLSAQRPDRQVDAVVPVNDEGIVEPLHALYRRSAIETARETIAGGAGVQSLLSSFDDVLEVRMADAPPHRLGASLTNINTQRELAMLENSYEPVERR